LDGLLLIFGAAMPTSAQSAPSGAAPSQISSVNSGQETEKNRPEYRLDQGDEDWSSLCNRAMRGNDFWDPLKCVALGRPSWYVSFGGQLKGEYELYRNYNWGDGPQDGNGYYLNRVLAHSDFHFGARVRVFAEFESGLEFGRNGGPRPSIDEDKLDVGQLFLELTPVAQQERAPISLRIGRQELNYGEGTLVATRELNVRRPFDGIKLVMRPEHWQVDIFAVKPVETRNKIFDDAPDPGQTFWGVWATKPEGPWFIKGLDLYYLGLDRKAAQFNQGTARERRHTLGFTIHERTGRLSLAQIGDFQVGTFGSGRLLAWKFAQGASYSFSRTRYQPILGVEGAISSGDKDSKGSDLETFYPLFPKGLYYGYMVFTSGSLNAIVVHPNFAMHLSKSVSLGADSFFLWRQRTTDGLYSQSGMFLRTETSGQRYIGGTQDLSVQWQADRHTAVQFLAAYYEVGPYLRETQPQGRNTTYVSVTAKYTF
jgi:hypothetical protein